MTKFRSWSRKGRRTALAVVTLTVVVATSTAIAIGAGNDPVTSGARARALAKQDQPSGVKNNPIAGAIARRDAATRAWRSAVARYRAAVATARKATGAARARKLRAAAKLAPHPYSKPEYVVVWAGHGNASDESTQTAQDDAGKLLADPSSSGNDKKDRFVPGLDGFVVLDARQRNVNGTRNLDYRKVVNFVSLPLPWGYENEPHHMQYAWENGDPLLAGGLFNDVTYVLSAADAPNLRLQNTITPEQTPGGSVPDAYDGAGKGRFIGTYMGGPNTNYAGSPGEVVAFKPDAQKGLVIASETPAGAADARDLGNPGGIPEPCNSDEAAPINSCANPHGVQVRPDLGRMITSDYAEPRMVVLDPAKSDGGRFFRPTVRIWDTSNPDRPKLVSVAHMPSGWRPPASGANTMHLNRGIMENAKTWPTTKAFPSTLKSKGDFAGAMCGGGLFFTPDVTKLKGESSKQWNQVFDDGIAMTASRHGSIDNWIENGGACEGGAWTQVSRNNRWLFRIVTGQAPNIENDTGRGLGIKILYALDIQRTVKSGRDGHIACDMSHGTDTTGDGKADLSATQTIRAVASGKRVADCPRLLSTLTVDDRTSGGPHWGAIDNHSLTADGFPTRLVFANYFVARSGVDGDHRMYMVKINPKTGRMTYDTSWRDEQTGQLGVNFNRTNWPGNAGAGFYKPHSMLWVCPPGICAVDSPAVGARPARKP